MTETWLTNNIANDEIIPKGYDVIRKDRNANKRGGGVLIAPRDDIVYNRAITRNCPKTLALELKQSNSKKSLDQ